MMAGKWKHWSNGYNTRGFGIARGTDERKIGVEVWRKIIRRGCNLQVGDTQQLEQGVVTCAGTRK